MKLSCTPISYKSHFAQGDMDIQTFAKTIAQLGGSAIDLLSSDYYPWVWRDVKAQQRELPRILADHGLTLAAHGCGNNFSAAEESTRQREVARVIAAIEEAAGLGAPIVRLFGGHIEPHRLEAGLGAHVGIPLVMSCIEQVLPVAQRQGVTLALENHSNMPGHAYEIAAILEHFDSPSLRCLFDCANFMGNSMDEIEDPHRALDILLPHVVHVHVKDVGKPIHFLDRKCEACVAGQGDVPLRQLIARFENAGYQGCYSLEYEAAFKVPEEEGVRQSMTYLRNVSRLHQSLSPETAAAV